MYALNSWRHSGRADGQPMAMAGVWQDWEEEGQRITSCAIFTTEANAKMAEIHHRLPVILGPND
ncbi:MAG: SOS response-associated peptidase family protein [Paracoccaceae bacterium]|nr:SOS response-associated peptidase [Paracoccaceae bacterium]MDG1256461.1 SOS response-associated peptidase family protein [Paracoccaceae bacterium]MDG1317226.1 SOS response-associated peptidase family protein [Paracoccaceae bacterium]